jgi:hypothetical protein
VDHKTISFVTMTGIILSNSDLLIQGISRGGARWFKEAIPPPSPSRRVLADLYKKWFLIGSLIRFSVSGNIGVLFFYIIERFIYHQLCQISSLPVIIEEYKDSVSYFSGYLLQIVSQHLLNAFLVYGLDTIDTKEKYIKTLVGQFSVYGLSLVGSTILNLFLLSSGMERNTAFFSTMIVFAVVNYFLIQWVVHKTAASVSEKGISSSTKKGYKTSAPLQRIQRGGSLSPPPLFGVTKPPRERTIILNPGVPVNADTVNESRLSLIKKQI